MKSVEQREGFGLMFYVGDIRCFQEGGESNVASC